MASGKTSFLIAGYVTMIPINAAGYSNFRFVFAAQICEAAQQQRG
jgi:hypothetical protein